MGRRYYYTTGSDGGEYRIFRRDDLIPGVPVWHAEELSTLRGWEPVTTICGGWVEFKRWDRLKDAKEELSR